MSLKNSWGNLHVQTHASTKTTHWHFLGSKHVISNEVGPPSRALSFPEVVPWQRLRCPLWNGANGTCRAEHKEVVRWGGTEGIEWEANGTLNSQFIICSWYIYIIYIYRLYILFFGGEKKKAFSGVVHLESYHWTDIELTILKVYISDCK